MHISMYIIQICIVLNDEANYTVCIFLRNVSMNNSVHYFVDRLHFILRSIASYSVIYHWFFDSQIELGTSCGPDRV